MYENLIAWSKKEYASLPWRKKRTLYKTLVSEIMLQQTTVATVLNHFDRFLKIYPNLKTLASSTEDEICMAWKGLGYYRRARSLRSAAIDIVNNHGAKIPKDYEKLISISGIGEYTANAIIGIGKNEKALALDANLERVLTRIYGLEEKKTSALKKKLYKLFQEKKILKDFNKYDPRDLNEAFMDLGRVFCKANSVKCESCPVSKSCLALKKGSPLKYPKADKKVEKYYELNLLRVIVKSGRKILGSSKKENQWLSGQIEIPTYVISSEDKKLKQYPFLETEITLESKPFQTSITKYKIKNHVIKMSQKKFKEEFKDFDNYKFVSDDHLKTNFSTATLKSFAHFEKNRKN